MTQDFDIEQVTISHHQLSSLMSVPSAASRKIACGIVYVAIFHEKEFVASPVSRLSKLLVPKSSSVICLLLPHLAGYIVDHDMVGYSVNR